MNARERYLASTPFARLKECDLDRANRDWMALPVRFRAFLAKHAGLEPERGEVPLGDLSPLERKQINEANARLVEFAVAARAPLLTAIVLSVH